MILEQRFFEDLLEKDNFVTMQHINACALATEIFKVYTQNFCRYYAGNFSH